MPTLAEHGQPAARSASRRRGENALGVNRLGSGAWLIQSWPGRRPPRDGVRDRVPADGPRSVPTWSRCRSSPPSDGAATRRADRSGGADHRRTVRWRPGAGVAGGPGLAGAVQGLADQRDDLAGHRRRRDAGPGAAAGPGPLGRRGRGRGAHPGCPGRQRGRPGPLPLRRVHRVRPTTRLRGGGPGALGQGPAGPPARRRPGGAGVPDRPPGGLGGAATARRAGAAGPPGRGQLRGRAVGVCPVVTSRTTSPCPPVPPASFSRRSGCGSTWRTWNRWA